MSDPWSCYPVCVAVRDCIDQRRVIDATSLYKAVTGTKQRKMVTGALRQLQNDHPVRWQDPIMKDSLLKRLRGMETVLMDLKIPRLEAHMLLYKIKHGASQPVYFKDKRAAKMHRDDLVENGVKEVVVIMRGPDHWKGESFNKTTNTPSTQKGRRR